MLDLTILYRMVGGFIGLGPNMTFLTRVRWAVPMGLFMGYAAIVHHMAWLSVVIILTLSTLGAYLGRLIPHARFQATASLGNSLGMALVNAGRLALILAPFALFDWYAILLSSFGVMAGVAYYAGWKWLDGKDSGIYYRTDHAAIGGSEWGELLTGLLCYQFAYAVLLVLP